jgi:hypothetical protein
MRFLKISIAVIVLSFGLGGCTVLRVANAWVQPKDDFSKCTSDIRIMCQPGSEELAKSIVPLLPDAIETVERAQFSKFAAPIVIYIYNTRESFSIHSGASVLAAGAASLGALNLSPKLLSTPERTKRVLTHELSHLNLQLQMGTLAWARVPSWFHEGLATWVSNGGGAENVSEDEAYAAIKQGKHFEPDDSQWALFPKNASSYGLEPHMYYRQAAIFVAFMHDHDAVAFEKMFRAIEAKTAFAAAIESSFHESLPSLWQDFLATRNLTPRFNPNASAVRSLAPSWTP